MKNLLSILFIVVQLGLFANNTLTVSGSQSIVLEAKELKHKAPIFQLENTQYQPFIALDIKIIGSVSKKAKLSLAYDETEIDLHEDIHIKHKDSWSSELQFIPATAKNIHIKTKHLGNQASQVVFNFFYPDKTEMLTKKAMSAPSETDAAASINCSCPIPTHQSRADWDPSGTHPAQANPTTTTVTHLIVHHAAGANTSSDWAATVRSIWNYHVNSNGWSDIGYNYLIDPNGVIYEGRGNNILGAHFSGMNGGTMGVCLLGNYHPNASEDVSPSTAMQNSLVELLSWKACDIDQDPLLSSYHPASSQTQMNISGHRDAGTGTVCPGDNVYDLLPSIRSSCSAYIPNCSFATDADLVVSSLETSPSTVILGANTELNLVVGNGGSQDVLENIPVELKVDGNLVQNFTLDSLQHGALKSFSFPNYQFSSIGSHQLCAYIGAASNEANTANNSYCITIDVQDSVVLLSDIVVQDIVVSNANPQVAETVSFTFVLKNIGSATTSETVDATIKIDGQTKQVNTVNLLNVNQTQSYMLNTSFATEGVYQVCIAADSPSNENATGNNSFCKSIDVQANNTSINRVDNFVQYTLFPNPTQQLLQWHFSLHTAEKLRIEISNSLGQRVFYKDYSKQQNIEDAIETAAWSNGVYFMRVLGEKTSFNTSVVKQ